MTIGEFARAWALAWNSHDSRQVLSLMTDDIVYSDDYAPSVMYGHADVETWLKALWTAFPDLEFEILGAYGPPDGSIGALRWRARATHQGEFAGVPATGRTVDVVGADFHQYRDGRMCQVRGIYDHLTLMRQLDI
ncbi:conserved hypothetical protein, steroid delta-isomerase-related [Nonomuraea solani]|uniref:SnoaL-like polyketide cyclase n=1 Tax=Nonomuraea solani TaxID=1144553 RepID=A0A1H6ECC5_9ACTN|nr:ester cyclase [Nonomuraea solani]SEG95427.1 conserved hypothetical protein, steroid delta-isomerase-related [Nonomuraea solani]